MNEIKSTFGSLEETNRALDVKERLAPKIALARFGWKPVVVGRILVVPSERTVRRVVARHAATMDALYPARSREVRAWLRMPDVPIRGIWFVSDQRNAGTAAEQIAQDATDLGQPAQMSPAGRATRRSSAYFADLTQDD